MTVKKGYSDTSFGQVHWRAWGEKSAEGLVDLYCLHPAPFSGLAFQNIAPFLSKNRRVIAPDYPGYGGSDASAQSIDIEGYAKAMREVISDVSEGAPVDALGFHTGCLVAAELTLIGQPVTRLTLIDVPAFPADQAAKMVATAGAPPEITDDLSCLAKPWKMGFSSRYAIQGVDQAFAMFSEAIRPGMGMNVAFKAAFEYPWQERFEKVATATMVLATQSSLLEGSRHAASVIPRAHLVERLDVSKSVLDANAETIAKTVMEEE